MYSNTICSFFSCRALARYVKLLMLVKKYNRQNATIADIFAEYVAKQPEKVCLIFEDRKWTFREVSWRLLRLCDYFD